MIAAALDPVTLVRALRVAAADLGASLSPAQWKAPSLCDGWTCGDVVGHLAWVASMPSASFAVDLVRAGGRLNRATAAAARRVAAPPQAEVCERLRRRAATQRVGARIAPFLLADVVVHTQDIRRPLGIPNDLDPAVMRLALDHVVRHLSSVGGRSRLRGLELRATDIDWRHGSGRLVSGTAEQLLMVAAGRMSVVAELEGHGKDALAGRR
jgi:uncharacterized protein (TIGR03083 family)